MPTFFARRYVRKPEEVGNAEKVLGGLILLLVAGIVTALVIHVATDRNYLFGVSEADYAEQAEAGGARGSDQVPVGDDRLPGGRLSADARQDAASQEAPTLRDPFPEPDLEGWQAPRLTERFTADTLYVKIDGQAEAYLQFHVAGLVFGSYYYQSDTERTVDVYWYDMGTPTNALGMYRSEEAPDATRLSIGRAGYQAGGAVFFCKGASYVQVLPSRPDGADGRAALKIAERLAERIADQ